jgi:hypothetical protein
MTSTDSEALVAIKAQLDDEKRIPTRGVLARLRDPQFEKRAASDELLQLISKYELGDKTTFRQFADKLHRDGEVNLNDVTILVNAEDKFRARSKNNSKPFAKDIFERLPPRLCARPLLLYDDLRSKWVHEDDLIDQRVTWLLTSQVFFATAIGLLAHARFEIESELTCPVDSTWHWATGLSLRYLIGELIVIATAILLTRWIYTAIAAAVDAMSILKNQLKAFQDDDLIPYWRRIDVLDVATKRGADTPKSIGAALFGAWIIILAIFLVCEGGKMAGNNWLSLCKENTKPSAVVFY